MSPRRPPSAGGAAPLRERTRRLSERLAELELDGLLVGTRFDLRYLTGFTGSNGLALIAAEPAGAVSEQLFLTDFRYETQSAQQVPEIFRREIVSGDLFAAAARGALETGAGAWASTSSPSACAPIAASARLWARNGSWWRAPGRWPACGPSRTRAS